MRMADRSVGKTTVVIEVMALLARNLNPESVDVT